VRRGDGVGDGRVFEPICGSDDGAGRATNYGTCRGTIGRRS